MAHAVYPCMSVISEEGQIQYTPNENECSGDVRGQQSNLMDQDMINGEVNELQRF